MPNLLVRVNCLFFFLLLDYNITTSLTILGNQEEEEEEERASFFTSLLLRTFVRTNKQKVLSKLVFGFNKNNIQRSVSGKTL